MKNKILFTILAILALSLTLLPAQTTNTPPPDVGFFGSVQSYLTSFNPELEGSLASHKGTLWSGAQWQAGAHISTSLGLSYKVYKNIAVESETRFGDVTGTVFSQQWGLGYGVEFHDVRITGFARGSYEFEKDRFTAVLGVRAEKLLTTHTGIFTSLEVPVERGNKPIVSMGITIHF